MINLLLPMGPSRRTEDPGVFTTAGIYSPLSDFWYTAVGRPTSSRTRVTDDVALTYSAVWACTRLISSTIGGLPLNLLMRQTNGAENVLREDPRNIAVEFAPNDEMNAMMFKGQASIQQVNGGNCFSEIERDVKGRFVALWPIHRSRGKTKRGKAIRDEATGKIEDIEPNKAGSDLYYEVKNNDGTVTIFDPRDILHVPSMMSDDGISGKGTIAYARETIGFGLATERYGAKWFGTGGVPRVVVKHKGKLSEDARRNFRKEWKELYGGSEGDMVALLTEGAEAMPININNEDSQFLQTRGHNIEEVARWYGVPVHMLQRVMQSGVSGIEQIGIEFVTYTMMPWFRLWEQELHRKLLTADEQSTHFFRFNVTELLRGDARSRAEYLRTCIQIGIKTPNEGRLMEGDNPYPDPAADKLYMQGAMVPIENVGQVPNLPAPESPESQKGKDGNKDPQAQAAVPNWVAEYVRADRQSGLEQRLMGAIESLKSEIREKTPDETKAPLMAAARLMLEDAADRVRRKECWAAKKAAESPEKFGKWINEFYDGEYRSLFVKVFSPICSALVSLGVSVDAERLAERCAAESREALLTASECTAAQLGERVGSVVENWEKNGAQSIADAVIPKAA